MFKVINKFKVKNNRLLIVIHLFLMCFFIEAVCWAEDSTNKIAPKGQEVSVKKKVFKRKSEVESPVEEVERETKAMLSLYKKKYEYFKNNVEEFIQEVKNRLESRIDFDYISQGVMSSYGKIIDDKTRQEFTVNFRDSLFRFYGKAVLAVDHPNVIIQNMELNLQEFEAYKKGTLRQLPVGMDVKAGNKQVKIIYKMIFNEKEQKWVLRNILVDSLNVGVMFRKVFQEAMESLDNKALITEKMSGKQKRVAQVKHVVKNWRDIVNARRTETKETEPIKDSNQVKRE